MKNIVVITSKESKSGAEIIYVDGVRTSRANAEAMYENRANSNDIYIWAVGLSGIEIMELVRKAREEMPVTYSVEIVNAEVEVEETEEVAAVVAAATFETVEVKAVEVFTISNITVSKFGVFYKAVKIFCKAIKLAAVSKNFNNSNDFNNICKAIKLAAISKNFNSKISAVAAVLILIEKLKAGGVSIRGAPYFKGLTPFFIAF